ncbi:restriction endonuclease [Chlorobaculum thiosulfatiphilum]|uniref:Restriction endonuclease n=1 Tax=Chlorobaculum thiosulfatiphilum TaxID=115852 RepID=A0A5C4SBA1_CHLTI|nr:BglII/BstYI family type II restriction endonuclease [Chlorobaculum thiosulfatiphilum]TNJ40418.1 restriction endonuclease [Chlorobaculum thiosulfatiphilum]
MKISETYSHLNGLEYLLVRKPELWREIQSVIAAVDATQCCVKVAQEKSAAGALLFSPVDMNAMFIRLLREKSWQESRRSYCVSRSENLVSPSLPISSEAKNLSTVPDAETPITISYNQTDFIKERVSVEFQFGKYGLMECEIFAKPLAFYVGDRIDVGIEILPMKSLQAQMSSGVPYYEGEIYNVVRQGRGVPAVPLVIVGIEP